MIPTDPQHLIDIKASYIYSLEEAREIANNIEFIVRDVKQKYMDSHPVIIDRGVDDIMDIVLINVLKHAFKKEIGD